MISRIKNSDRLRSIIFYAQEVNIYWMFDQDKTYLILL
jgi:hypothetical protein